MLVVEPGQVIADRYRLERPIERGAMGAVWRATHVHLESPVAIKFLNPAIADDPEMLRRFLREAQSAALVRSSHVVQVFDYGVELGAPYIAMELLEGESLNSRLDQGALSFPELDKIFCEVAHAVAVAHDAGVIHRDLKPGNVFIVREGEQEITKVLDFGIAKWRDQKLSAPTSPGTHSGVTIGTPHYMSPEQARGERSLDHRTDIWSLAVLAFECLSGRAPFQGETFGDLLVNICTNEPVLPSSICHVPPGFDAWFLKGVMKDPDSRFASAREMASALHALLSLEAVNPSSAAPGDLKLLPGPISAWTPESEFGPSTHRSFSPPSSLDLAPRRGARAKALIAVSSLATAVLLFWFLPSGAPSISVSAVTPPHALEAQPVIAQATLPVVKSPSDVLTRHAALAEDNPSSDEAAQPAPELEPSSAPPRASRVVRKHRATRAAKKKATTQVSLLAGSQATKPASPGEGSGGTSLPALETQSTTKAILPAFDPFSERL